MYTFQQEERNSDKDGTNDSLPMQKAEEPYFEGAGVALSLHTRGVCLNKGCFADLLNNGFLKWGWCLVLNLSGVEWFKGFIVQENSWSKGFPS